MHRRCIAILTGEADAELAATVRAAAEAAALAEAAEVAEFSPNDSEDDAIWLDESMWTEVYHVPLVNAHLPIQPPLPRFIPG